MAESFTLSTASPNRNPSPGGLRPAQADPNRLSINAPRIDINAGNVSVGNVPIPNVPKNIVLAAALDFGKTLTNAAVKYQDRESTVYASQAALAYQDALVKEYEGYSDEDGFHPGYSSLVGQTAVDEYDPFVARMDKARSDIAAGLDPRTRQKFLVTATSTRNTYLQRAAKIRVAQFEVVERNNIFNKRNAIASELSFHPETLHEVDDSGLTKKQRFEIETCYLDTDEECSKAWLDKFTDSGKLIYLRESTRTVNPETGKAMTLEESTIRASQKFTGWVKNYAEDELEDNTDYLVQVLEDQASWEADAIRAGAALKESRRSEEAYLLTKKHTDSFGDIVAEVMGGRTPERWKVGQKVDVDDLSGKQGVSLDNWLYGNATDILNPELYEELSRKILAGALENDMTDPDIPGQSLTKTIYDNWGELGVAGPRLLQEMGTNKTKADSIFALETKGYIKRITTDEPMFSKYTAKANGDRRYNEELWAERQRLAGESTKDIRNELLRRLNEPMLELQRSGELDHGTGNPQTMGELQSAQKYIKRLLVLEDLTDKQYKDLDESLVIRIDLLKASFLFIQRNTDQ